MATTPYVTICGFNTLNDELENLWIKRREVTKALSAAAAEGDRSENAEYIYRKKQLREIDRRIRYLQKRLPDLTVVDKVFDESKVLFGAWVTIEDDDGNEKTYRIVGGDEISTDMSKGYISVDSPMAKALLKKQCDDEFELTLGGNKTSYVICAIDYDFSR